MSCVPLPCFLDLLQISTDLVALQRACIPLLGHVRAGAQSLVPSHVPNHLTSQHELTFICNYEIAPWNCATRERCAGGAELDLLDLLASWLASASVLAAELRTSGKSNADSEMMGGRDVGAGQSAHLGILPT